MGARALIMLLVGMGGSVCAVWRPFYGLMALVGLYFIRPDVWGSAAWIQPVEWITIATLLGWLIHEARKGVFGGAGWFFVLMIMYVLATCLASSATAASWLALERIVKILLAMFLIVRLCDTPRRLAALCLVVLVGCLWFIKVILISWASYGFSGNIRIDTGVGQGGGSNYLAWVLSATMPLLLHKAVRGRGWERKAALGMLALWLTAIVATGSRGGLLCTAASTVVVLLVLRQGKVLVTTGLCAVLLVAVAPARYWERISTLTTDPDKMDNSALARYQNVQAGMRIIQDHPMFGTGLDTFPVVKMAYVGPDYVGGNIVAHNTYIQMACELGLPFVATFVLFMAWLVNRLRRSARGLAGDMAGDVEWVRVSMLAALAATAIQMGKGDMAKMDIFWWIFGIALAAGRLARAGNRQQAAGNGVGEFEVRSSKFEAIAATTANGTLASAAGSISSGNNKKRRRRAMAANREVG